MTTKRKRTVSTVLLVFCLIALIITYIIDQYQINHDLQSPVIQLTAVRITICIVVGIVFLIDNSLERNQLSKIKKSKQLNIGFVLSIVCIVFVEIYFISNIIFNFKFRQDPFYINDSEFIIDIICLFAAPTTGIISSIFYKKVRENGEQ